MSESVLQIIFCVVVAVLFSLNFDNAWNDKTFEKLNRKRYPWYWFRVLKIEQTKENYAKVVRGLSAVVIGIMTLTIVVLVTKA